MVGPIDYIIVGFTGNKFDGSILAALTSAIDQGIIRIVALSLIQKDASGKVTAVDLADGSDTAISEFRGKYITDQQANLVNNDDITEVGELLENDTAAGLLVVEQLWAKPLKQAIIKANGTLIAEGRIHPEAANEMDQEGGD